MWEDKNQFPTGRLPTRAFSPHPPLGMMPPPLFTLSIRIQRPRHHHHHHHLASLSRSICSSRDWSRRSRTPVAVPDRGYDAPPPPPAGSPSTVVVTLLPDLLLRPPSSSSPPARDLVFLFRFAASGRAWLPTHESVRLCLEVVDFDYRTTNPMTDRGMQLILCSLLHPKCLQFVMSNYGSSYNCVT
jgi:hypothetical protein